MKILYLKPTLDLLIQLNGIETVKELAESGQIKQTEEEIAYLIIENNEENG